MNEEECREKIVAQFSKNPLKPWHCIAKKLKIPRSTVNRVLNKFNKTLSTKRKSHCKGKCGAHDIQLDKKIKKTICRNRGMSVRDVAKKCGTNESMIQRAKNQLNLKTHKKQKIPKVTEKQKKIYKSKS